MNLKWDSTQADLREGFRRFGQEHSAPGSAQRDREGTFDHDLWQRLAKQGLWRLLLERERGHWEFLAAFEGLAAGADDFGLLTSAIAHAGLIRVLLDHGTPSQLEEHLPTLLTGGVGATAATEAQGGSHVASVQTAARRCETGYLLSGEKRHVTNAPIADRVLVVGRVTALKPKDITLFLVKRSAPGVSVGEPEDLLGQRTSPTGSVLMSDVPMTPNDVIGGPGLGLERLYSFLAFDRLLYGVAVAGLLEPVLERALERVHSRQAFGVPLAEHEYVQEKLVDMKLTMEQARLLSYSAADALERGDPAATELASLAKLTASEGMVRAGLEFIQIFGHSGYERANGIERVLRDAVALRLAGGTTEMQKKNVFKSLCRRRPGVAPDSGTVTIIPDPENEEGLIHDNSVRSADAGVAACRSG